MAFHSFIYQHPGLNIRHSLALSGNASVAFLHSNKAVSCDCADCLRHLIAVICHPALVELPGVEVPDPVMHSAPDRPLLKAHKALPRRKDIGSKVEVIQIFADHHGDHSNGAVIATARALPLTPPAVAQDSGTDESEPQDHIHLRPERPSIRVDTPARLQHLPTPEVTPPRNGSLDHLDLTPIAQTISSSRADSFRTAFETIPSDAETERSNGSSSLGPLRRNAQAQNHLSPEVPRDTKSGLPKDSKPLFDSFDGQWADTRRDHSKHEVAIDSTRDDVYDVDRQFRVRTSEPASQPRHSNTSERQLKTQPRGAVDKTAVSTAAVEEFAENIGWASTDGSSDPTDSSDRRRLSGVSTTSTVEAVIVDSPPPAKRALRHTEKRASLRSVSSPITNSERTSASTELKHRLTHKAARITEQDRRSASSGLSASASSTLGAVHPNVEVVPVVVIPERRSSLQSTPNGNPQSKYTSRRSSQRATSLSESKTRSLDDQQTTRIVSDPSGTERSSQPVISVSAPTSKTHSRASLTSESLRQHTSAIGQETPEKSKPETPKSPYAFNFLETPNSQKTGADDMAILRPPSLPFTQSSIPSSSPGPVEINEATTVSFFPHNNTSLLLVNQQAMSDLSTAPGYEAGPESPQIREVSSPLKNPRPPPHHPVCKVVPPTPEKEVDRQLGQPVEQRSNGFARRLGSVRRALSSRQRSDPFNSVNRSSSIASAESRKAAKEVDGKLNPFWRPRRFWDDAPEMDSPPELRSLRTDNTRNDGRVNNSLGMPQERVVIEGPRLHGSPTRKFGSHVQHYPSRDDLINGRVLSPDMFRTRSPLHQSGFRSISWLRLRWRSLRPRSLRRRFKRSAQRRKAQKMQARRETLKQSIGDIVSVKSSNLNAATVR